MAYYCAIMNNNKKSLTPGEKRIMKLIIENRRIKDPTVRELARLAGYRSFGTIQKYIEILRQKGWLEYPVKQNIEGNE